MCSCQIKSCQNKTKTKNPPDQSAHGGCLAMELGAQGRKPAIELAAVPASKPACHK